MKYLMFLSVFLFFSLTACSHQVMVIKHTCVDTDVKDIGVCDEFRP